MTLAEESHIAPGAGCLPFWTPLLSRPTLLPSLPWLYPERLNIKGPRLPLWLPGPWLDRANGERGIRPQGGKGEGRVWWPWWPQLLRGSPHPQPHESLGPFPLPSPPHDWGQLWWQWAAAASHYWAVLTCVFLCALHTHLWCLLLLSSPPTAHLFPARTLTGRLPFSSLYNPSGARPCRFHFLKSISPHLCS